MVTQKPILSMLEHFQMYLMQGFSKQRVADENWKSHIGPHIFKILEKNKVLSAENIVFRADDSEYQVSNMYGTMYKGDIASQTYSCKRWDLSGTTIGVITLLCVLQYIVCLFFYSLSRPLIIGTCD